MRHVRTVTKAVHPAQFASWTLAALAGALDYYFRVLYGAEPHPAHREAPEAHLVRRLAETGLRLHRLLRVDRTFLIETCPMVDRKGTRVVDAQRGVKVEHLFYWTDAFRLDWDGRSVPVRVDPWDARVCYVLLGKNWHRCICKLTVQLRGLTRVELEHHLSEMRAQGGVKKLPLTPERVTEWLIVMNPETFDPRLRATQAEARHVFGPLGLTAVEIDDNSKEQDSDARFATSTLRHELAESGRTDSINSEDDAALTGEEGEYELY
jgi:putative transposase